MVYNSGIQVCLPSLINDLQLTPRHGKGSTHDWKGVHNYEQTPPPTDESPLEKGMNFVISTKD
jgi:hypothetical protein